MPEEMSPEMIANVRKTMSKMLTTLEQKVEPGHTAILVVDVLNDFCAANGFFDREGYDLKPTQEMVPKLVNLIAEARKIGASIIFIRNIYNTENNWYLSDVWLEHANRARNGCYVKYPVCAKGSWGGEFYDGIKPLPNDVIVNKHRYNAFIDTDLDLILRSKGIRTLIMTGTATNVCVETTARHGFLKDYYIVFTSDCTATISKQLHNTTLKNISLFFGEVVTSKEIIKCWEECKA